MPFERSEPIHFGLRIGPQDTGWFKTRRQRIDVSKLDEGFLQNIVVSSYHCHGRDDGTIHAKTIQGLPLSPHLSVHPAARRGQRCHAETQLARPQPSNIDDSSRSTTVNRQPRPRASSRASGIINDRPRYRDDVRKDPHTPSEIAPGPFTLCSGRGHYQRARVSFRDPKTPLGIAPASFTLCSGRQHFRRTDGTHSHSSHRDSTSQPANLSGGRTRIEAITSWTEGVARDPSAASDSSTRSTMPCPGQAKRSVVDKGAKARDHYRRPYVSDLSTIAGHSR